jgi:intracellular septation protein
MTETADKPLPRSDSHWLRAAVDFGALALFGIVYAMTHDLLKATWAIVAGSMLTLAVGLAVERRIAPLPLIMGLFALVFGGLTLITHNTAYLKMEGSFLYFGLGLGLLIGARLGMNPLKELLGAAFQLPDSAWKVLTVRYALFFLALGVVNELVRRFAPDSAWAGFKIGKTVLSVAFGLAQVPLIMKHGALSAPAEKPSDP